MMKDKLDCLKEMKKIGCRKDVLERLIQLLNEKNESGMIQQLMQYRDELQIILDYECKTIDCLDYLIYEIEKKLGESS